MTDCLIVGGGLLGLLTARELASTGLTTTLIDQGDTGRESSWAGGGIVSPLYPWRYNDAVAALAKWSQIKYPELCHSLTQSSDIDPEHINSGMLIAEANETQAAETWAKNLQIDLSVISSEACRQPRASVSFTARQHDMDASSMSGQESSVCSSFSCGHHRARSHNTYPAISHWITVN